VSAILRSGNRQFVITDSNSFIGAIPKFGTRGNEADPFAATAAATIEPGTPVTLTMLVHSANWAHSWTYTFTLVVGAPAGSTRWGPKTCASMPAAAGISGLAYNTQDGNIYCTHVQTQNIYVYSSDSMLTFRRCLPTPEDSCTDIDYCEYDNTFWLLGSKSKTVYKLDATSGVVLRSFTIPIVDCPYGLVENQAEHKLYVSDRRKTAASQQRIFVFDTMGTFIKAVYHPKSTACFASRCLALDQGVTANPPSLLSMFAWCDTTGTVTDSCVIYEINRTNFSLLNSYKFTNAAWDLRGIEYDVRDGCYWVTVLSAGGNNNVVVKIGGFHNPPQVGTSDQQPLPGPGTGSTLSARPNPFTRATTISLAPGMAGPVELRICDNSGRLVRTLSARRSVVWDGRNQAGQTVTPGVYFCGVSGDAKAWTKVVLSR